MYIVHICFEQYKSQSLASSPTYIAARDLKNSQAVRKYSHSYWLAIFWTTITSPMLTRESCDKIRTVREEQNPEYDLDEYDVVFPCEMFVWVSLETYKIHRHDSQAQTEVGIYKRKQERM